MQVKENTNIVQSNFLLENRPKFTKDETRLFLTIVGAINKDDEDFKQLEIPVTEFAELWGMETKTAYNRIKAALRGLVQKEFFIEGINQKTGKTRFLSMSYVSMATYEQGEGYATVEVSQMFKPYLLALKKNYTKYVLENILSLTTVNAIRNYELLKQYENLGTRTFTVDEYKKLLGIENKYSRNTDLRVNVVEPAKEEINQNTDIFINYEFVGRGKKARIVFTILANERKKALLASAAESEASDQPSEAIEVDEFTEDYSKNPMSLTFETAEDKENYVTGYIENQFTNETNRILADFIPEEIHQYEEDYINAIQSIVREYSPFGLLPDARALWIANTVGRFTRREWPLKKSKVRTSAQGYYKTCLEYWLADNQEE